MPGASSGERPEGAQHQGEQRSPGMHGWLLRGSAPLLSPAREQRGSQAGLHGGGAEGASAAPASPSGSHASLLPPPPPQCCIVFACLPSASRAFTALGAWPWLRDGKLRPPRLTPLHSPRAEASTTKAGSPYPPPPQRNKKKRALEKETKTGEAGKCSYQSSAEGLPSSRSFP